MPRDKNQMDDSLAVAANNFHPPQNPLLRYEVEVRYRPSIPYNVKHWQVFKDEEQVKHFIETVGEFSNLVIDAVDKEPNDQPPTKWEETLVGHHMLQLKWNAIRRGLVPLERLFDINYIPINPNKMTRDDR